MVDNSNCTPTLPPLTYVTSPSATEESTTVENCLFIQNGEHPPCTYPVTVSNWDAGIMDSDFSPTDAAAFFRSSSLPTGTTNTQYLLSLDTVTRVLNTLSGSSPSMSAICTPVRRGSSV